MDYGKLHRIFDIKNVGDFEALALEIFRFQYLQNPVYREFCQYIKRSPEKVDLLEEIPFLPISFFKSHKVIAHERPSQMVFESSGTTGSTTSKHLIADLSLYRSSFQGGFEKFYGNPRDYCILALLPSYLEREGSSLVFMANELIENSKHSESGFYLNEYELLHEKLIELEQKKTKTLLLGVSFALLDFIEKYQLKLNHTIVMETGGMKGKRKEIIREELHNKLKNGFGVNKIHSEYGMTELLSQAYSSGNGIFKTPPWMQAYTRDTEDPLQIQQHNKTGGINIIDLANVYSCSFIATQDLGKTYADGNFEVLGRFDNSDVRGCNLMVL